MKHVKLFEAFVNEASGEMKFHALFTGVDYMGHRDIMDATGFRTAGKGKHVYMYALTKDQLLSILDDVANMTGAKSVRLVQASSDNVDKKDFSKPIKFDKIEAWIDEQTPDKMYFFPKEAADYKRWFGDAVRSVANNKAGAYVDYETSQEIGEELADLFIDYIKNHPDYDIKK